MAKTTDGMKIIDSMIGGDRELRDLCEQASLNAHVAQLIYDARTEAGLSQAELAGLIGTTQSVISRLEDADYEGHSREHLTYAMSINTYSRQQLENLQLDHKEK